LPPITTVFPATDTDFFWPFRMPLHPLFAVFLIGTLPRWQRATLTGFLATSTLESPSPLSTTFPFYSFLCRGYVFLSLLVVLSWTTIISAFFCDSLLITFSPPPLQLLGDYPAFMSLSAGLTSHQAHPPPNATDSFDSSFSLLWPLCPLNGVIASCRVLALRVTSSQILLVPEHWIDPLLLLVSGLAPTF